MHFFLYQIGIM